MGAGQSLKHHDKQPHSPKIQHNLFKKNVGAIKLPPINDRYIKSSHLKSTSDNPLRNDFSLSSELSQKDTPPQKCSSIFSEPRNPNIFQQSTPVLLNAASLTLSPEIQRQKPAVFKLRYNIKNCETLKIACIGARPAVGKTTLIRSFIVQSIDPEELQVQQTIGTDIHINNYELNDTVSVKLQIWEFESNDQNLSQWRIQFDKTNFDGLLMVFDEFCESHVQQIEERIKLLHDIVSKSSAAPIPIMMVGNDRLNMMITGKEQDIELCVKRLYKGTTIGVRIINFKQLKEINQIFKQLIESLYELRQTKVLLK